MKTYHFTGHLHPLPPGIKLPLGLSGDVCLPSDVEAEIARIRASHETEVAVLRARIERLRSDNEVLRKRNTKLRAKRRS